MHNLDKEKEYIKTIVVGLLGCIIFYLGSIKKLINLKEDIFFINMIKLSKKRISFCKKKKNEFKFSKCASPRYLRLEN